MLLARVTAYLALSLCLLVVERLLASRISRAQNAAAAATDRLMIVGAGSSLATGAVGSLVAGGPALVPAWLALAAGLTLGGAGLLVRVVAIRALRGQYTLTPNVEARQTLVTSGPYRLVRHPGYAAILLTILGFQALVGTWVALLATLLAALPMAPRIFVEERMLIAHFGARYRDYCRRTPHRLVPGLL